MGNKWVKKGWNCCLWVKKCLIFIHKNCRFGVPTAPPPTHPCWPNLHSIIGQFPLVSAQFMKISLQNMALKVMIFPIWRSNNKYSFECRYSEFYKLRYFRPSQLRQEWNAILETHPTKKTFIFIIAHKRNLK